MVRLALQHLFQEVVGDLLLIAGQTRQPSPRHRRGPAAPAWPAQPRRPIPRSARTGPRPPPATTPALCSRQHHGSPRVQRKERGPDLDQIAACAEAAERHSRIAARDQHQLRAGSNLVDEKRENRAALLSRYDVHVVQHQNERVALAEVGREERKGDLIDPAAPVVTTPPGAHRKPGPCAQEPPRHGRAAQRGRCRRGRAAPTRWPSDPGRSTARQESTSRNPPAQKPAPPGCARRPGVTQRIEVDATTQGRTVGTRSFDSHNSGLVRGAATLLIARPSAPAPFVRCRGRPGPPSQTPT